MVTNHGTIHWYERLIPCLLILFCFASFYTLGSVEPPVVKGGQPYVLRTIASAVVMGLWLYWLCVRTPRLFWVVLLPYFAASWLYMPQGLVYGDLTSSMLASLLATDSEEAAAYLINFPSYVWVLWAVYPFAFGLMCFLIGKKQRNGRGKELKGKRAVFEKAVLYLITAAVFSLCFIKPFYRNITKNEAYAIDKWFMPQRFAARLVYVPFTMYNEWQFSRKARNEIPDWQIESVKPVYQNYVVVIGESVRADYLPMYGYPVNTSPFLNRVNGIRLANYIAPAPNTSSSIPRILSLTDAEGKPKHAYTLVTLANLAGFETFWFSNQGKLGRFDIVVGELGVRAKQYAFTKLGDYSEAAFMNDEVLLPHLKKALQMPADRPKLIVLHLIGSHPGFCDRISKEPVMYLPSRTMSCYLESLMQTDQLLEKADGILKQQGQSYSVVYFSDHGLSSESGWSSMIVGTKNKQNYAVPFIRFSSDSTKQEVIYSRKSGFDALSGLAQWMGIRETQLSRKPDFFAEGEDGPVYVFNQEKLVDFDTLADDPAQKP